MSDKCLIFREEEGKLFALIRNGRSGKLLIPERKRAALEPYIGQEMTLGIRPESFLPFEKLSEENALSGSLDFKELLGAEYNIYMNVGQTKFIVRMPSGENIPGTEELRVAVDTEKMHFFDKNTEKAVCH